MNNIKDNDYFNVVVQALAHVPPLRNFFMLEDLSSRPQLVQRFSILTRKIWNPRAFKSHVSPHELLQEISLRSNKGFTLTQQSDPVDFLSWFLNNLHLALGGSKTKPGTSIVQKVFQGKLKMESQQITAKADAGDRLRFEEAAEVKVEENRFMMLTLDLPAAPLFQDELDRNIIPQVSSRHDIYQGSTLLTETSGSAHNHPVQVRWATITRTSGTPTKISTAPPTPPIPSLPHQALLAQQVCRRAQPYHCDVSRTLARYVAVCRAITGTCPSGRTHLVRPDGKRDARGGAAEG